MRAKLKVESVLRREHCDEVKMKPVTKTGPYPENGFDEDNTFSKFTPSGDLTLLITNPELVGKIQPGQKYYVDFTLIQP